MTRPCGLQPRRSGQVSRVAEARPVAPARRRKMVNELLQIPGVGPSIAADFVCQGLTTIASLRGQDPEHMYARQCELQGGHVDRCFLYVCRCAVYFAEHTRHDPAKLK